MKTNIFFAAVAGITTLVTEILAAPIPDTPSTAVFFAVDGVPSCAKTTMTTLLGNAASYGCPNNADGTLNTACLCKDRTFKAAAKSAVVDNCSKSTEFFAARVWALTHCSDVRAKINAEPASPGFSPRSVGDDVAAVSSSAGEPLAPAVFLEIEEIDDETAAAPRPAPLANAALAVAIAAAAILF